MERLTFMSAWTPTMIKVVRDHMLWKYEIDRFSYVDRIDLPDTSSMHVFEVVAAGGSVFTEVGMFYAGEFHSLKCEIYDLPFGMKYISKKGPFVSKRREDSRWISVDASSALPKLFFGKYASDHDSAKIRTFIQHRKIPRSYKEFVIFDDPNEWPTLPELMKKPWGVVYTLDMTKSREQWLVVSTSRDDAFSGSGLSYASSLSG